MLRLHCQSQTTGMRYPDKMSNKMKTLFVCKKRSGNYIIASYKSSAWELVAEVTTPKQLKEVVNSLGYSTVIKDEYSKSQLTTKGMFYNKKDALRAFGISASAKEIAANF